MNFKIGDKVRFLNEKGEGVVTKLINKTIVGITIEDGFEFPYSISELVLIYDKVKAEAPLANTKALSKILFQKQTHSDFPKKSKPHSINNPAYEMEINLHIEELLDNYKGMSNAEIIQVQLKHFQRVLDSAINDHYRKLIVIHGVGNGRLKQEVRIILSSYNNLQYYDASYSKYGFGATEVLII